MKSHLHLETTIPSYLTSRPRRDLIVAGHQQITRDWRIIEGTLTFDIEAVPGGKVLADAPDLIDNDRTITTKLSADRRKCLGIGRIWNMSA